MTENFDPYRKWLGIPPDRMPPDHYRLLGIGQFESDPDVIWNAADRQMAHVRTFQSGKQAALSQQILNELSSARICLLDTEKKSAYDAQLRQQLSEQESAASPSSAGPLTPPPPAVAIPAAPPPPRDVPTKSRSQSSAVLPNVQPGHRATRIAARRKKSWQGPVISIGLVILLVVVAVWAMIASPPKVPNRPETDEFDVSQQTEPTPSEPPPRKRSKPPRVAVRPPAESGDVAHLSGDFDEQAADTSRPVGEIDRIDGHVGPVLSVAVAPNTVSILSGGQDKQVRLWDTQNDATASYPGPANPVLAVDISSDGQLLATVSGRRSPPSAGVLHVWKSVGGPPISLVDLAELGYASDARFSPDGQQIAIAGNDNTVRLVPINGDGETVLSGHEGPATGVAFSPDGKYLLSGSEDGSICVWNVSTGRQVHRLIGSAVPPVALTSVAYSHDGSWALSGNQEGTLRIWNLQTKRPFRAIPGHTGSIRSVDFSPEGLFGLSGGDDGVIRFWNLGTGREILALEGHEGPVHDVRFSPGGRRAVSCGEDMTIRTWKLPDPSTSTTVAVIPQHEEPKATLPSVDRIAQAEAKIRTDTFRDDFAAADRPSLKQALCMKLFEAGKTGEADARAYAQLNIAREMAIESKKAPLALEVVDQIDRRFEIDRLATKTDTLRSLTRVFAGARASSKAFLAERALGLSAEAVSSERLDEAARLVEMARPLAAGASDKGSLSSKVAARAKEINRIREEAESIRASRETLEIRPDDPDANEKVGKYVCWIQGNWPDGLPSLTKTSDAELKRMAQADLDNPGQPERQFELANGWWDMAEKQTGIVRNNLHRRAAYWYQLAEPGLTNSKKQQALQRLGEVEGDGAADKPDALSNLANVQGFDCRREPSKSALLEAHGVEQASEEAVARGLKWLIAQQNADGSWGSGSVSTKKSKKNSGSILEAPNAATALALWPLMGAGQGSRGSGIYRTRVNAGLRFLKSRMVVIRPHTATLFEPKVRSMPSHALGTMVLCEAAGMGVDRDTRIAAVSAVNFIIASQNDDGGWGLVSKLIQPNMPDPSDTETTAWHVAALQTARWAELDVSQDTFDRASQFLDACSNTGKSDYTRTPPSKGVATSKIDAHATASAYLVRHYLGWPTDRPELVDFLNRTADDGPGKNGDFLLNYKKTFALRHQNGDPWQQWNPAIHAYLLQSQETVGEDTGSWYIPTAKSQPSQGGRLGCTSLSILMLESAYRYPQ